MTSPTPPQHTPPSLAPQGQGQQPPESPNGEDPLQGFFSNMSTGKKLSMVDRCCGIGVSIVIHLIILVVFSGVTLISSGDDFGTEEGTVAETIIYDQKESDEITSNTDTEIQINSDDNAVTRQEVDITQVDSTPTTKTIKRSQAPGQTEVITELRLNSTSTNGSKSAGTARNWSSVGSRRGQGGGGNTFFDLEISGSDVVYIIDLSGSMAKDRLPAAKRELVRSIKSLSRTSKFFIIFYNDKAIPMERSLNLVRATSNNKSKYINWIQNDEKLVGNGGTFPSEALRMAYKLKPDTIFLLTDGVFLDPKQVIEVIKTQHRVNPTKIHSIAYFTNEGEPLLRKISEEITGGGFKYVERQSVLGR